MACLRASYTRARQALLPAGKYLVGRRDARRGHAHDEVNSWLCGNERDWRGAVAGGRVGGTLHAATVQHEAAGRKRKKEEGGAILKSFAETHII